MLIDFSITNYKSIKNTVHLNMVYNTGKKQKTNEELDEVCNNDNHTDFFKVPTGNDYGRINVCPVMVLFGANASGKSNILKAFLTMRAIVLNGYAENFYTPFKFSSETEKAPTKFKIIFSNDNDKEPRIYEYGIEYTAHSIKHEYLKDKDTIIFDTDSFDSIPKDLWQLFIVRRKPIMNVALEVKNKETISDNFEKAINDVNDFFQKLFVADDINLAPISDDVRVKNTVKNWLFRMDMKFCDIDISQSDVRKLYKDNEKYTAPTIQTIQYMKRLLEKDNQDSLVSFLFENDFPVFKLYNINMKYAKDGFVKKDGKDNTVSINYVKDESTGTKNLFRFLFVLIDALQNGKIIIFDEIDRTIHTELLNFLFGVMQTTNLNKYGAQMICSSHNPYVIKTAGYQGTVLVEKWVDLATHVISLSDRNYDSNIDIDVVIKDYLSGLLGGMPRVIDVFETMEVPNV